MSKIQLLNDLVNIGVVINGRISPAHKRRLNNDPIMLQRILDFTDFLQYGASIKVRIMCVINGITEQPLCVACGKYTKMAESGKRRYTFPKFCCSKCIYADGSVLRKRKQTNMKKYGATNFLASEEGQTTREQSLINRYGVDNAALIEGMANKRNQTILKKYGSIEAFNDQVQKTRTQTMIRLYGVEHAMQDQIIKDSQMDTRRLNLIKHNTEADRYKTLQLLIIKSIRNGAMAKRYSLRYVLNQSNPLHESLIKTMIDSYHHQIQI